MLKASRSPRISNPATPSPGFFPFRADRHGGIYERLADIPCRAPLLTGREGELIQVRVSTEPRLLEDFLECLASVPFPINPQIYHGRPTIVEFPAYEQHLYEVRDALRTFGFDPSLVRVSSMIEAIAS